MRQIISTIVLTVVVTAGVLVANVAEPWPAVGWDRVEPLFAESCTSCHDAELAMGGADLSSYEASLAGDEPAAVPYDLSCPLVRILTDEPRSGMRGPDHTKLLSEEERELVFAWIEGGCYEVGWGYTD